MSNGTDEKAEGSNAGLERKPNEFYYFPNVVCDCGHFMRHGFNYLECSQAHCNHFGKKFKMKTVELEEC